MKVKVFIDIPERRIEDMLIGAFEGGSTYWCMRKRGKYYDLDWKNPRSINIKVLDLETAKDHIIKIGYLKKGIAAMNQKAPKHFADLVNENDDADTADIFLQFCIFGDIVYG